ncbi:Choline-sulfatase [Caulifigura coniformis]|uniref:Choline-sulfatase n=1 Tax=Caulifigura coniformis TaxID=2527983 RepID=A0A517SLY4_9PLAN|nr:sulfatase [Caulifigura coniformis]QDT57134.1 Choline-sulfatase [Caulifigura coniformis]
MRSALVLLVLFSAASLEAAEKKLNVLFIAVDDLRPELGCYGTPIIKSPHIDALAAKGMVFERAYCQQAVCSPTRSSLLTGRRPDTTKVYDLVTHFRRALPDVVTLPQAFKDAGWHTQSFGKIYHGGYDDPASWTDAAWFPGKSNRKTALLDQDAEFGDLQFVTALQNQQGQRRRNAQNQQNQEKIERDPKTGLILKGNRNNRGPKGVAFEASEKGDSELADGMIADAAIARMREIKDRPFFLAVGFMKPHLPFIAPKKYFDLYDPATIPMAKSKSLPTGAPEYAGNNSGELRGYTNIPDGNEPITDELSRELKHAYYAATSYMDAQLGRVVAELDALGLRENTVIILWGDHGWKLGDHGLWCKHCNWEPDTRCALVMSMPGQTTAGQKTSALVEYVDVFPTLCDVCGIDLPEGLEGTSFAPLLKDPKQAWKSAAFSQYPRAKKMGYSMRTARYRYTEWQEDGNAVGRELYDYEADPNETASIADRPENAKLVEELSAQLKAGWKQAKPR